MRSSVRLRLRVCGAMLLSLVLAGGAPRPAAAQSVSGTLLGTVTDSTSAAVTGAKVTITNEGTGLTRALKTDANGEYTAPSLPTGLYTILVEMDGFKTAALSGLQVGVDQRLKVDVPLEVGALTESVTIEASSPLIQAASSELGTTVTSGTESRPCRSTAATSCS